MSEHMTCTYFNEAVTKASRIASQSSLIDIVVLDQWRRNKQNGEWRLTYLSKKIGGCSNNCGNCSVYHVAGGEDIKNETNKLVTTLVPATPKDLAVFDGKQRYLNCKSLDQYISSFVKCFTQECHNVEEMLDELDYVAKFRVIYYHGKINLSSAEKKIKKRIINECIKRYPTTEREIFLVAIQRIDALSELSKK